MSRVFYGEGCGKLSGQDVLIVLAILILAIVLNSFSNHGEVTAIVSPAVSGTSSPTP